MRKFSRVLLFCFFAFVFVQERRETLAVQAAFPREEGQESVEQGCSPFSIAAEDNICEGCQNLPPCKEELLNSNALPPETATASSHSSQCALSWQAALQVAMKKNEKIATSLRALDHALVAYRVATNEYVSDFFFRLRANGEYNTSSDRGAVSEENSSTLSNLDQEQLFAGVVWTPPWFHKEGKRLDSRMAQIDVEIARAQHKKLCREVLFEVYKSYYDVVLHEEKLAIEQTHLQIAEARQNQIAGLYRLGAVSELQLITEDGNVLTHRNDVMADQSALTNKRQSLFSLLGLVSDRRIHLINRLKGVTPLPFQGNIDQALDTQVEDLRWQLKRQEIEVEKANQRWFPKLTFHAAYLRQDGEGSDRNGANIGMALDVPFPNNSLVDEKTALAKFDLKGIEFQITQNLKQARREITVLLEKGAQQRERIQILQQLLAVKRKEVEVARRSFELGRTTSLDLRVREGEVRNVERDYNDVLFAYLMTNAELRQRYGYQ
jgi:outer membrane protein TolC